MGQVRGGLTVWQRREVVAFRQIQPARRGTSQGGPCFDGRRPVQVRIKIETATSEI